MIEELKKYFEEIFQLQIDTNENLIIKCKTTAFIIFYYIVKYAKEQKLNFNNNIELKNISVSEIARLFN